MGSEHNQQMSEHKRQVSEHKRRVSEHRQQVTEHSHQVKENNGFNRLQEILKSNKVLLDQMCNRNKIKKVIVEAAVHHFSTLPSQKQLEVVAQYLERSGQA